MKDVSKGTEEIFQKWSMERRIHATDIRIQALYQALRPEEGQTSEEIIIQEKKLKSLELHSIKYSFSLPRKEGELTGIKLVIF